MLKKFLLFALVVLPVTAFAQEKIAYLNYADVVTAMPEFKQMQDSLSKSENDLRAELQIVSEEFAKKYSDYIAQRDSLNESIKLRREQELDDMRQRAENFQQFAAQKQEEMQQRMSIPIREKLQKAINDVGRDNNFLYIVNSEAFLYISPNAADATPIVKRKLGIQ